ncbi:MAG: mechanosensitive ion channel family protein [Gemmatimonadota bacterium]|nr:mechanosensitive ion channel family protein [Gemmatimonadota bacterium]
MQAGQIPGVSAPADTTAAADSIAAVGELSEAIDRIGRVRSLQDLWELAGEFQGELIGFALELVLAGIVLIVFVVLYHLVAATLQPVFERSRIQEDAADLLLSVVKYSILGFGVILALDQVGFSVTGLLAGIGVAGLAIGFAAKDTLANFIAGITILWDRPFRVGDRVEVDGEFGQVKKITLRSTRIHTNENMVVIIPNQNVVNNKIVNHTMQASVRLDVPFGIAYKEDIDETRRVVTELVEGDDRVRERPEPEVVLTAMADSAVQFELRLWLKNPHHEVPLGFEYREKVKKALDAAGIAIPFPHLSLYVEEMPQRTIEEPPAGEGEEG